MAAKKREQLYESFRVIFATPQTIENDLRHGKLDRSKIIMLIFGKSTSMKMSATGRPERLLTPRLSD